MWNLTAAPPTVIEARVLTRLPDALRRPGRSDWADANKGGEPADCFLEGPSFDRDGHLWLTDIPHGRIFRVSPSLEWQVVGDYRGWPNGLAFDANGRLVVAHASLGAAFVIETDGSIGTIIRSPLGGSITNIAFRPGTCDLVMTESNSGSVLVATLDVGGEALYSHD